MNGRMTFLHCVCLTLAGVFILALAPKLSGVPPENASARDKGQVKSASRLVTSPDNQVAREINNEGSVASGALIELKWLAPQGSLANPYPAGTTGVDSADLTIPGAGSDGQPLWLGLFFSGWDDQFTSPAQPCFPSEICGISNVQGTLDNSALPAGLSVLRLGCEVGTDCASPLACNQHCIDQMGVGGRSGCNVAPITNDTCSPAFQDFGRADALNTANSGQGMSAVACAIATDNISCGGNVGGSNDDSYWDDGTVQYLGTFVLLADQSLVGGPHAVDLLPPNGSTFMSDGDVTLKIAGLTLTIDTGSCCFGISPGQAASCVEDVSRTDCASRAAANSFRKDTGCPTGLGGTGGPACCECFKTGQPDPACADGIDGVTGDNQCTDNFCDNNCICQNPTIAGWDDAEDCCDPTNAGFSAIDDDDSCTDDSCSLDGVGPGLGVPRHDPSQAGTPCDDKRFCTHTDLCGDKDGVCSGTDINSETCNTDDDCEALVPGVTCCEGICECHFELGCCLADGGCDGLTCPADCEASGGTVVAWCKGDGNGNGLDDACDGIVQPGTDCWRTKCGRTKFSFSSNPIPADFFGPGSEPFDGVVTLGGAGPGDFDTSMRRQEKMVLGPPPSSDSTPIELVSLDLISCDPINVGFPGNQSQEWNVSVKQSTAAPDPGTLTVNREHDNGGVFTAEFYVQPVFTFTRADDPNDVRILDTAAEGIPPAMLETIGGSPYVHTLAAGSKVVMCGTNFAPGVEEDPQTGDQCCRKVGHSAGPGSPPGHIHETSPPKCTPCSRGACCLPSGACQVAASLDAQTAQEVCEVNLGGEYKGDSTDCSDSDGDGLADILENGTGGESCPVGDRCNLGTNPLMADTDGDGCLDSVEVFGDSDPCDPRDPSTGCPGFTDNNENGIPDEGDLLNGLDCDGNGKIDPPSADTVGCDDTDGNPAGVGRADCKGACCHGLTACVEATQDWCDSRVPDARGSWSFRGLCTKCPTTGGTTSDHQGVIIRHFPESGAPLDVCINPAVAAAVGCIQGDLIDAWQTDPTQEMCHQFGVTCPSTTDCPTGECSPPIPADFFGPGSDPFVGEVCLEGVPLGGMFGEADTLIRRSADPFDRCDLPSVLELTVDAEIIELSLQSKAPITVTFNGGQDPELWDVAVGLSDTVTPPMGEVSAIKTHCNGGTYSSVLNVQPKFTFTKVGAAGENCGDPGKACLDTGTEGICHVTLIQGQGPEPDSWLSDLDPGVATLSPFCTDFHPGFTADELECYEGTAPPDCDCNCNASNVRDRCDIEDELSQDCNQNLKPDECELSGNDCNSNNIPDECEPDCNGNGQPDDCDIDPTDPDGNGLVSPDCNGDGTPDECENDCNGNGVADECDVPVPAGLCTVNCSEDCNENGTPDECEPDCNGNGLPDGCDLFVFFTSVDCTGNSRPDECDIRSGTSPDCQPNGTPDDCDISEGTSPDVNSNGIPDECEIFAPGPLGSAPNPWDPDPEGGELNRTGGFAMPASAVAGGEEVEVVIRIRLVDLYVDANEDPVNGCPVGPDFSPFEDEVRYLGPPSAFDDNDTVSTPQFVAAELQCTPFYRDWSPAALTTDFGAGVDTSTIYYYGAEVLPCSLYEAQQATQACIVKFAANELCFSTVLEIRTALWGDIWPDFGLVNFTDIGKMVDAFKSIPFVPGDPPEGAPRKVQAMLRENSAPFSSKINFTDIGKTVDAFKSIAYREKGPTACP